MNEPIFPRDFVLESCLKVREERRNRKTYCNEIISDDEAAQFAECAFMRQGFGLTCENCGLHVSSCKGSLKYQQDKHFEAIDQYYKDMKKWEKQTFVEQGAGI